MFYSFLYKLIHFNTFLSFLYRGTSVERIVNNAISCIHQLPDEIEDERARMNLNSWA